MEQMPRKGLISKRKISKSAEIKKESAVLKNNERGMHIDRIHTVEGQSVYDSIAYKKQSAKITNPDGSTVFEMNNVEVPAQWSQLAVDIVVSKYFRKAGVPETGCETSVKQLVYRVANTLRNYGDQNNYFASPDDAQSFESELTHILLTQRGAFNSPVWFNCGLHHQYQIKGSGGNFYWDEEAGKIKHTQDSYSHPQCSACFIQRVDDDLMSIFELCQKEARIFKFGSGTGTNFSKIRGDVEKLSGGGLSSGLMSFLSVLDRGAGATKSGGTTRRAAKMVCLDADHPEIMKFIKWKSNEEDKVAALVSGGYSSDFNGEAYRTVGGQNSNNSVRVNDDFMHAVEQDKNWSTKLRTTGEIDKTFKAREVFDAIAESAWKCADPGLQYDTTINDWHTCPNTDRINASNPCSEYMFLDDSACNLASINLMKYLSEDGKFDIEGFRHAVRIFILAQEIIIDFASYPTEKIALTSHRFRTLGLGYANLGTLLMVNGIPYDSDEGRAWAASITAIMQGEAYKTSAKIAAHRQPFDGYAENKDAMARVMNKHLDHAKQIGESCPDYLKKAAVETLADAVKLGGLYGYRNAQVSVLAPTGTIGLLMDCDTTGIEPDFSLVKFKKLAGGGYFKIVNNSVPSALAKLGYRSDQVASIIRYAIGTMSLTGTPFINRQTLTKKGILAGDLDKIELALKSVFQLEHAFNGVNCADSIKKMGIQAQVADDPAFSLLKHLGFSSADILAAEEVICGAMTVEGAPHLKDKHLPIFDCANPCGKKGKRFLSAESHLKMMAAVQPFISGAISKTVNLPNSATVEDIKSLYMDAWKMGVKAVALYRDGCKFSQPLSSNNESKTKEEKIDPTTLDFSDLGRDEIELMMTKVLDQMERLKLKPNIMRHRLPKKRLGFTVEAKVGGHKTYLRTGEYGNGKLGEIFIDMHKEGAAFRSLLNCFAIAVSKGLQHGVPLEEFVDVFTFARFEPYGMVDHENIKSATSVVDFIFRVLGMEYLARTDFVHVKPNLQDLRKNGHGLNPAVPTKDRGGIAQAVKPVAPVLGQPEVHSDHDQKTTEGMYESFMGDAPPCSDCGHTTVRNGSCYRCLNCGNSMGCS